MTRIFISYRREDTKWATARLFDYLSNHFGRTQVFMDIDTIGPGEDFVQAVERAIGSCDALVAVIGAEWLDVRDSQGRRRLDDENDYVRREIAAGLEGDVWVVPVLIDRAPMPKPEHLPDDLKMLARRNALEVSTSRFEHDVQRLVATIEDNTAPARAEPEPRRKKKRLPIGILLGGLAVAALLAVIGLVGLGVLSAMFLGGGTTSTGETPVPAPVEVSAPEVSPQEPEPADTAPPLEAAEPATGITYTNVRFCNKPCDEADAAELAVFPEGTKKIYVSWEYAGMQPGMNISRDWSNRGENWLHLDCVWQGPESGTWQVELTEPGGLRSGTWTMTLRVEGEIVATASVDVAGSYAFWDPAGTLPCETF